MEEIVAYLEDSFRAAFVAHYFEAVAAVEYQFEAAFETQAEIAVVALDLEGCFGAKTAVVEVKYFEIAFLADFVVAVVLEWGDCSVVDRSSSVRGFLVALFGYLPVVVAALDWRYYFV